MDKNIKEALEKELKRQNENIELIASENYVSKSVMELQGSVFTNKYAEGYSGKRYYGGCVNVDRVEDLAIEYVTKLFNVKYANVQPHSGSSANMAVYRALLKPFIAKPSLLSMAPCLRKSWGQRTASTFCHFGYRVSCFPRVLEAGRPEHFQGSSGLCSHFPV